jgi:hypothetical protein
MRLRDMGLRENKYRTLSIDTKLTVQPPGPGPGGPGGPGPGTYWHLLARVERGARSLEAERRSFQAKVHTFNAFLTHFESLNYYPWCTANAQDKASSTL